MRYENGQRLVGPAEINKSWRKEDVLVMDLLTGRTSKGPYRWLRIFYGIIFL